MVSNANAKPLVSPYNMHDTSVIDLVVIGKHR